MEEDIKILKSIPNPEQPLDIEIQIAIEHLLNRLEQLEKENKELKISNAVYVKDNDYLMGNSIPKSVIREKIEELETNLSSVKQMNESMARFTTIQKLDYQIQILEELLGDE